MAKSPNIAKPGVLRYDKDSDRGYDTIRGNTRKVMISMSAGRNGEFRVVMPAWHEIAKMIVDITPVVSAVEHLQHPEIELTLLERKLAELQHNIVDFRHEVRARFNKYALMAPHKLQKLRDRGTQLPPIALQILEDYEIKMGIKSASERKFVDDSVVESMQLDKPDDDNEDNDENQEV